jgi:uncharacterized protein (TIGR03067 family)
MRSTPLAAIVFVTLGGACGDQTRRDDHPSTTDGSDRSRSIVGRWALDSLVVHGQDYRARSGPTAYYTLNGDGTFRITRGDSVLETGTWSQDTTVSPMIFDHNADHAGKPGPRMLGIFAITGDTLVVTITGPNPEGRHPTTFHSALADSSWLLVYHRAPR